MNYSTAAVKHAQKLEMFQKFSQIMIKILRKIVKKKCWKEKQVEISKITTTTTMKTPKQAAETIIIHKLSACIALPT